MRNHEHALCIRRFRERLFERGIIRGMGLHHSVVDKTQVITAAGRIVFGRFFTLHLLGAVIINHLLVEFVSSSVFREYSRANDQFTTASRLIIGIRKIQMFSPIMLGSATTSRVQLILCRIGIDENTRSCSKRVVRFLLLELNSQNINIQRIYGMHQREYAKKQCKNLSIQLHDYNL